GRGVRGDCDQDLQQDVEKQVLPKLRLLLQEVLLPRHDRILQGPLQYLLLQLWFLLALLLLMVG
ncbi:MAG: hypothetical protein CMO46_00700, partial [Verrucomicrobiales bacterium]|nr:hypothetical protein [Verrucomicrobiales bacterium]